MKKPIYKRKWFIVVVVIIFIAIIGSAMGGNSDNATDDKEKQKTSMETTEPVSKKEESLDKKKEDLAVAKEENEPTKEEKEEEVKSYKAGTYKVGTDIPSGEYIIEVKGNILGGYFEISKDSSGELDSIIANDNIITHSYLTINEGEYLKLQNAVAISVEDKEPYEPIDNKYQQGMYKVGVDIPAGEYKINMKEDSVMGFGYYEVTTDSSHTLETIVTNDNFENNAYIDLKEGQYIKLTDAFIEVK
ncbi:hypothetical protein [Vallitalea guaymasensis]|uniref:hypothetical protein n=1 Tax=Vallitalea guaymasensis TaxID=1185412 RepID=UPI000DE3B5D9|nr:hypothetical protein [Vallitalea guaymasensis]